MNNNKKIGVIQPNQLQTMDCTDGAKFGRRPSNCCSARQQTLYLLTITILSLSIHDYCHAAGLPNAASSSNFNQHQFSSQLLRAPSSNFRRISSQDPTSYSGGGHQAASTNAPAINPSQIQPPLPTQSNNPLSSQNLQSNQYIKATHEILLDLRQQMLTRSIKFDEHFRHLLSCSKISLHNMFADTYGLMYEHNTEIFTSMFEGLEQYYANGQIQLTKSMENFFERLYQKIFQVYNSHGGVVTFAPSYLECATQQLSALKPFKDVPEKLIDGIKHAFVAARTFVQALNNGIDIIKSIISLGQPAQCTQLINEKLLKNTLIGGSNQQIASPPKQPCLGFCEQVIRRCIENANLEALNGVWRTYVVALDKLAMKLSTSYNIETIINPLDVQISEAIMNFQENASNISYHVFEICGQPKSSPAMHLSAPMSAPHRINIRAANPAPGIGNQNRPNPHALSALQPPHWPSSAKDLLPIPGLPHIPDDLAPVGQKSPIIIDEIKNFMLSTKTFWQHLPNAVCTSNYTLGSNASKKQSNCFQEPFMILDVNSDVRYQLEMHQQIKRLNTMISNIESALAGREIDWSAGADQNRPRVPSNIIDNPNVRLPSTTLTPSTTTTTTEPSDDEDDPEADPDDTEIGSGLEPGDTLREDEPFPNPPEYELTTPDEDDPDDSTASPDTPTEPTEVTSNEIDQPNSSEGLITPPDQAGAQKSSQSSNKLLISTEHHLLFGSLVSIVLLLLNSFRNNQLFALSCVFC